MSQQTIVDTGAQVVLARNFTPPDGNTLATKLANADANFTDVYGRAVLADAAGNHAAGAGAVETTATDGFLYLPTCAGTPTGVPTAKTGFAPCLIDTTAKKLWVYVGGAWKGSDLS